MLCLIPARAGSQRIPNKNIRSFHGKPIIAYSIELALDSGLFDKVVVSTDSDEIGAVALAYGAEYHDRPVSYSKNDVGTQAVAVEYLSTLPTIPLVTCVLYATCPLLQSVYLAAGLNQFINSTGVDYVYAVGEDGWQDVGQFYWGLTTSFLIGISITDERSGKIVLPDVVDINTMDDWQQAEQLYEERMK